MSGSCASLPSAMRKECEKMTAIAATSRSASKLLSRSLMLSRGRRGGSGERAGEQRVAEPEPQEYQERQRRRGERRPAAVLQLLRRHIEIAAQSQRQRHQGGEHH